jgi:hypothetical protein
VLDWKVAADGAEAPERRLRLAPLPVGRVEGVSFEEQIRFEGWILGVG